MNSTVFGVKLLTALLNPLQQIQFSEDDHENPRAWSKRNKLANVAVIASMASKQRLR